MDIGPMNRPNTGIPVTAAAPTTDDPAMERQVVMAVQYLNKSELMGSGRELQYRRDSKTGHVVVQIRDRSSGEIVDQIPPEVVVALMHDLQQQLAAKEG
jgi:uncharacterized FlaG/YvyC family protein